MQATLKNEVTLIGAGLHSARPARLVIHPATQGGIRFRRVDVKDRDNVIPARYDLVADTKLCTRLSNADGVSISTVEHLMAAFAGLGITHALVDIDGPEIPILDGSSVKFVRKFLATGLVSLERPCHALRVLKTIRYAKDDVIAELSPSDNLVLAFDIDFPDPAIGRQSHQLDMSNGAFVRELSDCRTFCRRAEIEAMWANGLAKGGTLENAIVVDGAKVMNPEGFRRKDECVRHKMLDAMGDLALAGAPMLGRYRGVKAGHGATNQMLRMMFAQPDSFEVVSLTDSEQLCLPGVGVRRSDLSFAV